MDRKIVSEDSLVENVLLAKLKYFKEKVCFLENNYPFGMRNTLKIIKLLGRDYIFGHLNNIVKACNCTNEAQK